VAGDLVMVFITFIIVVVGYISKFATKGLVFLAKRIPTNLMLSGNLKTRSHDLVLIAKIVSESLTLISASLLAERLRGSVFSSSEGGSLEARGLWLSV
jgi:hypothetical protein